MPHTYQYPRPALTVDCVLFGWDGEQLALLLIERLNDPFAGNWALPGGFVDMDETVAESARRELEEETGITGVALSQLRTFSAVDRDPRERVVAVAHYALVKRLEAVPASDAKRVGWFPLDELPSLAFDHQKIVKTAVAQLRSDAHRRPVGLDALPRKFTLAELRHLYEAIFSRKVNAARFRRQLLRSELLVRLESTAGRSVSYRFDRKRYRRLSVEGCLFDF